jgi:hypothetical protein
VVAIFVELSAGDWVVVVGEAGKAILLAIEVAFPLEVIGPVRLAFVITVAAKLPVPLPVTPPVKVIVWSPVLAPEIELVPVTARVGVELPDKVIEFTVVGVIAPAIIVIAGVVVAFATVPEKPFAVATDTEVTVPLPPEEPGAFANGSSATVKPFYELGNPHILALYHY